MSRNLVTAAFVLILVLFLPTILNAQSIDKPFVQRIAWSPDGSKIAFAIETRPCGQSPNIEIVNSVTQQRLQSFSTATCNLSDLAWSPDSTKLAITSTDEVGLKIWDLQIQEFLKTIPSGGQGISSIAWKPDGTELAIAAANNGIAILTPEDAELLRLVPVGGNNLAWSPDGTRIASGGGYDDEVFVADIVKNEQTLVLEGNTFRVTAVDWSPDGSLIASGGGDHSVHVWSATTGEMIWNLQGHTDVVSDVVWRPASAQLASASDDGTIRIWHTVTGTEVDLIEGNRRIYDIEWSPDGTQLAYADADGDLKFVTPALEAVSDAVSTPEATSSSVASDIKSLILWLLTYSLN